MATKKKKTRSIDEVTYRPLIFNHKGELDMRPKYRNDPATRNYAIAHPDRKGEVEVGLGNELFGLPRPPLVEPTGGTVTNMATGETMSDEDIIQHKSMLQLGGEAADRELQRQEKMLLGESTEMTQAEIDKMIEDSNSGNLFT